MLGTLLAADSVCGRDGDVLEGETLGPSADPRAKLEALVTKYAGAGAVSLIPDVLPGGEPQTVQVWFYANQRHGGTVISSGSIAYFDGENLIGVVEINDDNTEPVAQRLPYHPILPAHIDVVRHLAGHRPHVQTSDDHVQARVLDGPRGGATLAACNRYFVDRSTVLHAVVDGEHVRLPRRGKLKLPAQVGVLCPVNYRLGDGHRIRQATAQLLGSSVARRHVTLDFLAPAGGEAVIGLSKRPRSLHVAGRRAALHVVRRGDEWQVTVDLPAGQPTVRLGLT